VVFIAIPYGVYGLRSEWGGGGGGDWQDFLPLYRPAMGPTQPPVQWVFAGGKAAGAWS